MFIKDCKKLKKEMEAQIQELIMEFEKETDLEVEYVDILEVPTLGAKRRLLIETRVRLK